jgi:hypothetical protein
VGINKTTQQSNIFTVTNNKRNDMNTSLNPAHKLSIMIDEAVWIVMFDYRAPG